MRAVFHTKTGPRLIYASYLALPVLGFVCWGLLAAAAGVFLAYGLDRYYPRWAAELNWREVQDAVCRLYESTSRRSGFDLLIGHRRATLFRYTPKQADRLAFLFPLKDWGDLLTPETQRAFGEHGAGVWHRNIVARKRVFFAQVDDEGGLEKACVRMLRYAVALAGANLAADVLIRPWGVRIGGEQAAQDGRSPAP